MKNGKYRRITRRAMSMLLAVLTVIPIDLLSIAANATQETSASAPVKPISTTWTKFVVWDWIEDMQEISNDADYHPSNETRNIDVGDTKYSRILFYQKVGEDYYYFNASPNGGSKKGDGLTTYYEDKITLDAESRLGNSANKEWADDLITAEKRAIAASSQNNKNNPKSFVTMGGLRTPYLQYGGTKEGYETWRLWVANEDDSCSNSSLCLVDDYENLDIRLTTGFDDHQHHYGANNALYRCDPWIIDKHCVIACAANHKTTEDYYAIWHWDNDRGGINEALNFELSGRYLWADNIRSKLELENFKIFLGKEYKVGTLAEDFTVTSEQAQTLGKPLYYIPKGKTITVLNDAVLTIDGVVFNDGEIVVKEGGLLVIKDGAKLMPFTKKDTSCGKITSEGSIVVGTDALLCGGSTNGIRIVRGGVVNFGVLAGESMYAAEDYSIDNRDTGWVIAGHSPSSDARARYVQEAIKDEDITRIKDPDKEFIKVGSADSTYNFMPNSIYGNTANVKKYGDAAVGSANDPKLTVMVRKTPNDSYEDLFANASIDNVSLRTSGNRAIYTVTKGVTTATHIVENQLVAAYIARGGKDREQLFTDLWVGSLDGAYFQLEPVCAEGYRLSLSGGSTSNGNQTVIRKADTGMDQWWHITKDGSVGVNTAYYIDNVKSKSPIRGLDISGKNNVDNRMPVLVYDHSDNGDDQRWLLVQNYGDQYFIRNACNTGVSLAVSGSRAANNTPVIVSNNSTYESGQYWRVVNQFTEDAYSAAVDFGTAVELIPQSATTMRLALADDRTASTTGINAAIRTDDVVNNAQRWRIEAAGTDDLSGVATVYYRIVEINSDYALCVNGTDAKEGAYVSASTSQSGDSAKLQFWYLQEAPGTDEYYLAPRGNSSLVVSAPNSENPASGSRLTLSANMRGAYQRWKVSGVETAIEETVETSVDSPLNGRVFELVPTADKPEGQMRVALSSYKTSGIVLKRSSDEAGTDAARWKFVALGAGELDGTPQAYYQIVSVADSTLALGFGSGGVQDGALLAQFSADIGDAREHWFVTENEDGTYNLIPRQDTRLTLGLYNGYDKNFAVLKDETATQYKKTTWQFIAEPYAALDGKTYTLAPLHAPNLTVGVEDFDDSDSANVELKTPAKTLYQQWTFHRAGCAELNGEQAIYYTVENAGSGKFFDLPQKNGKTGENVHQYTSDGGTDQQWFAVQNEDGSYTFFNRSDDKNVLAANQSGTTAGTNVIVAKGDEGDNQKWTLTPAEKADRFDGRVFYLSPRHAGTSKVLDLVGNGKSSGTQVQLYDRKETEIQRWRFELAGYAYVEGKKVNYYRIHSVYAPGMVLDNSGSTANGARPHLWTESSTNKNQDWCVESTGDGYYFIYPRSDTSVFLGAAGGKTDNNTAVELWNTKGENRQWKFTPTIAPETLGTYSILPKHAPGMHVGLQSNDSNNGTKLIIWEYNESSNYARWNFVKMGTDGGGAYYKIVNMANGKVIDVEGTNTIQAGSQLQQWDSDFNSDQLWYLNDAGQDENGFQYYNILNRCNTEYCMTVSGGSTTRGTGVTESRVDDDDYKKFRLMERFEPVELGTYEFGSPTSISMRLTVHGGFGSDGANIILYKKHTNNSNAGAKLQMFKIIQRGNDVIDGVKTPYYSIENLNGKTLDPTSTANVSNGTNVQQYTYDGYSDQHWYMQVYGDGSVTFLNRADPNYALETAGTTDDSNVRLGRVSEKNSNNQRWLLYQVMETTQDGSYYLPGSQAAVDAGIPNASAEDTIIDPAAMGKYCLIPQHSTTLRMDLTGSDTSNGKSIQAYTNNGAAAQKWQIIPVGVDYYDGGGRVYYKIAYAGNTNKVAETKGYGPVTVGSKIQIWDYDGAYDQLWYFEPAGTAIVDKDEVTIYNIVGRGTLSSNTKTCIEVPDKAGSGTQLEVGTLQTGNRFTYQRWELFPTN